MEPRISRTVDDPKRHKSVSYAKWGIFFILPFLIVYLIFTLVPQILTISYSFFDYYKVGRKQFGPEFVGFKNYIALFAPANSGDILVLKYFANTMILWIYGVIPQLLIALLLAVIFTSTRLNIRGLTFFKTVFYMPNLIMASAFSLLFYQVFGDTGPVNQFLAQQGIETVKFLSKQVSVRSLIALMNFLMWFGNTTIVLMAGIQGIDEGLFESARMDGAGAFRTFKDITLPLLRPIIIYVFITSLIGGIQMFDVPQVLTNGFGTPNNTSKTIIMYLNENLKAKDYGFSGTISVVLFIITGILSMIVYKTMAKDEK